MMGPERSSIVEAGYTIAADSLCCGRALVAHREESIYLSYPAHLICHPLLAKSQLNLDANWKVCFGPVPI
jgi:hypothetical protein